MYNIPFMRPKVVNLENYAQYIDQIDESRVYSNYGPLNSKFETRLVTELFDGIGDVTTVNNATIGLILAITHLKKQGKYALMPSFTFSATPLAAMWSGLTPYFIDVDKENWCMNEELLINTIEELGVEEVAIIVPYATFGTCMDLSLYEELQKKGIPVVVDAAASFGARIGENVYGKNFPGAVVYSFHATKSFGVGEGGLIYSQDRDFIQLMKKAGNFGYYGSRETTVFGLNSKMSEYASAIALATLDVYEDKISKRLSISNKYIERIRNEGLLKKGWKIQDMRGEVPLQFFSIICPEGKSNSYYIDLYKRNGVQVNSYFSPPCHRQKYFLDSPSTSMDSTDVITDRIISLPIWEDMEDFHIEAVVKIIKEDS